jgi:TusA-related sulfurtransferase
MAIEVDARGLSCPLPVAKTKRALESIEEGVVVTLVDDETAKGNVIRLAKRMGCQVKVEKIGDEYRLTIIKGRS